MIRSARIDLLKLITHRSNKLIKFLGIQKTYVIILDIFLIFDLLNNGIWIIGKLYDCFFLTGIIIEVIYTIIIPLKPLFLLSPWIYSYYITYREKLKRDKDELKNLNYDTLCYEIKESKSELIILSNEIEQSFRNEITEYVLKGLYKSIIMKDFQNKSIKNPKNSCNCFRIVKRVKKWIMNLLNRETQDNHHIRMNYNRESSGISLEDLDRMIENDKVPKIYALDNSMDSDIPNFLSKAISNNHRSQLVFREYHSKLFHKIREISKIKDEEIQDTFSINNLSKKKIDIKLQSGKGGSFFIIPKSGKYLMKSISENELKSLLKIIKELYLNFSINKRSLITPIYSSYSLEISSSNIIAPIHFILMKNLNLKTLVSQIYSSRLICFDLKGSSSGRQMLDDPSILVDNKLDHAVPHFVYKDLDFIKSYKTLELSEFQKNNIRSSLHNDLELFVRNSLIDYSLLIFIFECPILKIEGILDQMYSSFMLYSDILPDLTVKDKEIGAQYIKLIKKEVYFDEKKYLLIEELSQENMILYLIKNAIEVQKFSLLFDLFGNNQDSSFNKNRENPDEQILSVNSLNLCSEKSQKIEDFIINFEESYFTHDIRKIWENIDQISKNNSSNELNDLDNSISKDLFNNNSNNVIIYPEVVLDESVLFIENKQIEFKNQEIEMDSKPKIH